MLSAVPSADRGGRARHVLAGVGVAGAFEVALVITSYSSLGPFLLMAGWLPAVLAGTVTMACSRAIGSPGFVFGAGMVAAGVVARIVLAVHFAVVVAPA